MLVRDDDIVWRTEEGWWNVCSIFFSSSVLTFFSLLLLSFPIFFTSSPPSLSRRIAPFPLSRPLLTIATSLPPSLSSPHPALLSSPHRISITNPPPSSSTTPQSNYARKEGEVEAKATLEPETTATGPGGGVKRKTLAGMLSEALCSRQEGSLTHRIHCLFPSEGLALSSIVPFLSLSLS